MIYTFYSFKGGVGRSMALANIAEAFHQQGLRVVMIDWDLEAPGLEVYFYGQDSAALLTQARAHVGLIDMLGAYKDGFPAFADRRTPAVAAGAMPVEHDAATRKVIEEILRSASDLPDFLREIPSQVPNAAEPPQTLHDFLQQLYSKL